MWESEKSEEKREIKKRINEIDKEDRETKRNETKRNETKRNEMKWNETEGIE